MAANATANRTNTSRERSKKQAPVRSNNTSRTRTKKAKAADRSGISMQREKKTKNTRNTKTTKPLNRSSVWQDPVSKEIVLILASCVSILLFLCNFGIIGPVGNAISSFLFGLFGVLAYIAPLFFAGFLFFRASNYENEIATIKEVAAIALFFLIGIMIEMFGGAMNLMKSYEFKTLYLYSSEKHGGGIISGSIAYFLCHYLSKIGCGFLITALSIVCIVLITEKSFLKTLKQGGQFAYEKAQVSAERAQLMKERANERREQRIEAFQEAEDERILRMNHKAEPFGAGDKKKRRKQEADSALKLFDLTKDARENKNLSFEEEEQIDVMRIRDDIHEIMLNEERIPEQRSAKNHADGRRTRRQVEESVASPQLEGYSQVQTEPTEYAYDEQANGQSFGMEDIQISRYEHNSYEGNDSENGYEYEDSSFEENANDYQPEEWNVSDSNGDYGFAENAFSDFQTYGDYSESYDAYDMEETPFTEHTQENDYYESSDSYEESFSRTQSRAHKETDYRDSGMPTKERPKAKLPEKMDEKVMTDTAREIQKNQAVVPIRKYIFPPINLLKKNSAGQTGDSESKLRETAMRLQQTLANFGVKVTITNISQGPTVTRYELQPEQGVKVSKIVGLTDDIKLNLAATDIRMEAPIPGKAAIGIEVPNNEVVAVGFRDLIESREFKEVKEKEAYLAFAVGKDIAGKVIVTDIAKMPHLLIAGATGSGKSVCINTIIMSLLYKAKPEDVKMIMIDPKVVELSVYNGIPHLLIPVVTEPKKAAGALQWGVAEMTERYQKFADYNVRDLKGFNQKVEEMQRQGKEDIPEKMPQIVIIVDELADLMMVAPGEVEESICRLAQLARAAGIHLIIATQRPSVDVITGLIKANMPSRIAFAVSSGVDSRTILDMVGAEKLLGKGDMLFYPQGYSKPARLQGAFISDEEVSDVVDFLKNQVIGNVYDESISEKIQNLKSAGGGMGGSGSSGGNELDDYFVDAGRIIIEKDKASIGMLQRAFKIGFNRAARIMDQLSEAGVVGPEEGTKPRKILMSEEEFENYVSEYV